MLRVDVVDFIIVDVCRNLRGQLDFGFLPFEITELYPLFTCFICLVKWLVFCGETIFNQPTCNFSGLKWNKMPLQDQQPSTFAAKFSNITSHSLTNRV
jgi:hypothetical protein